MPDLRTELSLYLDHVVERVGVDDVRHEQLLDASPQRSIKRPTLKRGVLVPSWVFATTASLFVLLLFGGVGYLTDHRAEPATLPIDGSVGLHDFPPEGAEPSTPPTGDLVASWRSHIGGEQMLAESTMHLYADGRLVWNSILPEIQYDGERSTGWIEQRLTPEGVVLIRDEILATGLFDPESPVTMRSGMPNVGSVQVLSGGQIVEVGRGPTQEWTPTFDRLLQRLRELHSWLPAYAWEDSEPAMYVPTTYSVCLSADYPTVGPLVQPDEPSSLLALLPESSQDLLADSNHIQYGDSEDPRSPHCYEMTTAQAQRLATTFYQAELPSTRDVDTLEFSGGTVSESPPRTLTIFFVPFTPHGPAGYPGLG